jgi:hypothetical protein
MFPVGRSQGKYACTGRTGIPKGIEILLVGNTRLHYTRREGKYKRLKALEIAKSDALRRKCKTGGHTSESISRVAS